MDENKINYSDLALRRGDSPTTINEKLLTEQTEHIFSEDQALEILSEFENNGIQAGMAKQLEVLLANKEEYENAIGENQDKKKIIVEKDNPNPENIRGYDEAVAQSREEIRKINEQIAALEKGLEEMNDTQNPEKDLPATEERTPEEPQNPATPVTPQDEDTRVAEARPVENNPETTQDTTDSKEWKNNPNDYRTILREIEKSENELSRLNSERDALKAAQENMDKETYQREMSTIERFLAGEQLKLDQNRNLANNYEAAYSLLKDLDGLTGQTNNSRDAQEREAREEEITAKRKELASHMDELTDTLATEVRNRVLSERANRNNNVVGLTPEQIISRYAPFAEIYDNNEIKETDPQVLVAEAERQIREREAAKEETAHKVAVRRIKPNRVINVIPSHVAGVSEEPTPEVVQAPIREEGRRLSNEEAQDAPDYVGKRLEDSQRQEPVREEGRRLSNEEAQDAPDYVGKRLEDSQRQEPVIVPTVPEVVQAPIREEGRRLSNEEAQDAPDYVGKRLEDSQIQEPVREEGRRLSNEEVQDAPDYVGKRLEDSQSQEPVIVPTVPEVVQAPVREEGRRLSNEEAQDAPDYVGKRLEDSQSQEPVITTPPTRRNVEPDLTPDEVIRRYGPAARIYDQAGITGTRAQRLVAAARDSLENQNNNNNGIKETDPQVLVAEAERQIREREAAKEETAHKVAVRRIKPNRVINVIPSHVAGVSEEPVTEKPVEEKVEVPETKVEEPVTEKPVEEKVDVPETKVEEPVTKKPVEEKVEVPETKVEEPTPEPVITTPPVSEEQIENTAVSTPATTNPNNPADALHNSDAQSEYNEALQDFLKIFDEERNEIEEKGPFTTMEALNEFLDKYFALKETANERLVNAKKRLEESRAKNAEQPRTTNTPNSSILALPAANKEKSPVLGLPPHVPEKSEIIDTYEGNPGPNMPKNPVLGLPPHKEPEKQPENNETKVKKGLYTIMVELTDGLDLTRKMNGKYTASNIRVVKGFKEELKSGNVLYNIAHFATAVVAIPINFVRKVVDKLTYSMRERENVEKFKERLSKLSQEDLETIWNEYRGTRVIQERYAVIIDTLINERMQQYALEKVSAIRKDMSRKYKILFDSMKMVESYDKLLQTETDLKRISFIKQEREKVLAGKAEMISSLRSQYIEANQILSGGAHGVSEDMKAAKTKLTIAGKRFAKDHDFNNELAAKQAEIEKRENAAIAKGDNEAALRAFIDGETLLRGKTEIKNTIYGQRSVGEKYSMPLPQGLDYRDDPFVRDLLRTVAYVGMGISAANALITHGPKSDALLQQNKADTDRVNAANDATIEQVHQAGDTLTGNRDDFITGMQSQTGETSVNISQSLERETLDSNSWYLGTEYNKMDAFNHARYNAMSDAAKAKLEDIATKCYNNQITDMQALEMIKEVANTQHQNLIDIYTEYQPILEQYASTHPFDLHGVQESMQFVLDHPDAVIKMNEGMVESIQVGEELAGLSAEHIAAINSLPSDLATTLFGVATSTAALTYQAASTMNNNVKSGKYGNEITDMIQDYIDSKAKANEAAPEEKSSGSGKSR